MLSVLGLRHSNLSPISHAPFGLRETTFALFRHSPGVIVVGDLQSTAGEAGPACVWSIGCCLAQIPRRTRRRIPAVHRREAEQVAE